MAMALVKETRDLNRCARTATLANGAVVAGADSNVAQLGNIDFLSLFLGVDVATNVKVLSSIDGTDWFISATWSPAGTATTVLNVPVAPFVKVNSSAACNLDAKVYGVGGC